MQRSIEFYQAFRFVVEVPEKGQVIGVSSAFGDPFTNSFWVGRGHEVDRESLSQIFSEATKANIYLFTRCNDDKAPTRRIGVRFSKMDWYPIDLNAAASAVAIDWIILRDAQYGPCEDLKMENVPGIVRNEVDPRNKSQ